MSSPGIQWSRVAIHDGVRVLGIDREAAVPAAGMIGRLEGGNIRPDGSVGVVLVNLRRC